MSRSEGQVDSTTTIDIAIHALRGLLRADGGTADERWRRWAQELIALYEIDPQLIAGLWQEVLEFDPTLAGNVAQPVPLEVPAVIVAGSGKETFKTFNVSTAASILAAAAGAYVVKGVSGSVSAVSGSADVLKALALPIATTPAMLPGTLVRDQIAFIGYSAFCPTYAGRYDGVFPFLSPFSFFMPIAVLGVQAAGFVYGVAHTDVSLAAESIQTVRPDLKHGVVVATELSKDELMDEAASYGVSYTAVLDDEHIQVFRRPQPPASEQWRMAVAHRGSHEDNAAVLASSLAPDGCGACAELVERNAALILAVSQWGELDEQAARVRVRNVRLAGGAARFLNELQDRREATRCSAN